VVAEIARKIDHDDALVAAVQRQILAVVRRTVMTITNSISSAAPRPL
jgi:hypothetical protein